MSQILATLTLKTNIWEVQCYISNLLPSVNSCCQSAENKLLVVVNHKSEFCFTSSVSLLTPDLLLKKGRQTLLTDISWGRQSEFEAEFEESSSWFCGSPRGDAGTDLSGVQVSAVSGMYGKKNWKDRAEEHPHLCFFSLITLTFDT